MLNSLQSKELSFSSGPFDPRSGRDPCAHTGKDSFAPSVWLLLCTSVSARVQLYQAACLCQCFGSSPSSPTPHVWAGCRGLHICTVLGRCVAVSSWQFRAAACQCESSPQQPLHNVPQVPMNCARKGLLGLCQQPKEITAENRLSPKTAVWVPGCPDGLPSLR